MKNKGCLTTILMVLLCVFIFAKLSSCGKTDSETKSSNNSTTPSVAVTESTESVPAQQLPDYSAAPKVFVRDLMRNYAQYEGKTIQVYIGGLHDVRLFTDHVYANSELDSEIDFRAYVEKDNMKEYYDKGSKDLIIGGVVVCEDGDYYNKVVTLHDAVVMGYTGSDTATLQSMIDTYDALMAQDVIDKEADFKANAAAVSYEDLLRYPTTWKDKPVYLTVTVKEIAYPDGFMDALLNGTQYLCMIPGTDDLLIVYDLRDVKEPTIMEGDTISFYGYPDDLGIVRTYNPNKFFNNTISRTEVPQVYIKYNAN